VRQVRFVTATREGLAAFKATSRLYQSLSGRADIYVCTENSEGLSKVYNRFLNREYDAFTLLGPGAPAHADDDIAAFVHDDVEVIGNNVESELNRWVDEGFSLLGLAGTASVEVKAPSMWHLMSPRASQSGVSVFHNAHKDASGNTVNIPGQPVASMFGPLREVVMLDGLFLAVALDRVDEVGWRFDEAFNFHHYDLASCIRARDLGLRLRTVFIPVVHWDTGQITEDVFSASERVFLEKYGRRILRV
jgi:hypothetical protein